MTDEPDKGQLLAILTTLDVEGFRKVCEVDETVPADILLQAMHQTRVDHSGVNRKLKRDSRQWLETYGTIDA